MTGTFPQHIPRPRLEVVDNLTRFVWFQMDKMAPGRRFFDTVVVKGAFDLVSGELTRAPVQVPLAFVDEPFEESLGSRSSLRRAGDVLLGKPGTDVFVTGTAHAPDGRPTRTWDTGVVVTASNGSKILSYGLQASGPRQWQHRALRGWTLSDPEPAAEAPIRYELAYGGAYPDRDAKEEGAFRVYDPNPAGSGFFDEAVLNRERVYTGPRWQSHANAVTSINTDAPLTGFGPIPRPWSSRLRYAGTYDAAWEAQALKDAAEGLPMDYPRDFDARFFQCAHPDLIAKKHLTGDEQIGLVGLVAGHPRFVTRLPGTTVKAKLLRGRNTWVECNLPLDTVHVDLDAATVHLSWRLTLEQRLGVRAAVIFSKGRT